MHRRQLVILYAVLSLVVILLGWRLRAEWRRANLRYSTSLRPKAAGLPVYLPAISTLPAAAPATTEILAKNLFSPDRNSEFAKDEKPQPPPPVPVVFGTMNLGGSYEALMAEKGPGAKAGFRRIKNGEQVGGYKVVEISDERVVIEYLGQKTTLDVYQSANSVPRTEARTAAPATPVVESAGTPAPQPAAAAQAANVPSQSAAVAQPSSDPGVKVTIEGNRKRFERQSMFGPQVWFEDLPPKQ